jgi:UDP:flavonoid glycosyltransferase YjiC (YdhE family)
VTGAWLPPLAPAAALPAEIAAFLDAGDAPVFVTFGGPLASRRRDLEAVVAALVRLGRRAIVQVAGRSPRPDVLCVAGPLDYPPLLARVRAVVHHGGAGTVAETVRAGRAALAVPQMAGQFFFARRIAELGLGPPPLAHAALAPAALEARLETLCAEADTAGARAAAIGADMAEEGGVEAGAAIVEAVAEGRIPGPKM